MLQIGIILPHIKKYGGVRRYLEFVNALERQGHFAVIFDLTYSHKKESEIKFASELGLNYGDEIVPFNSINDYSFDACICGDAQSVHYLDQVNSKLKFVNVIFPPYVEGLGSYGNYLYRPDIHVVGNGTGWNDHIQPTKFLDNWTTIAGAVNGDIFHHHKRRPIAKNRKEFKCLFMAKNRSWKGMDTIQRTIHECLDVVNREDPNHKISFGYFDTEDHPEFESITNYKHINLNQQDMGDIYRSYDCFISCEELAGWQNTCAEAMACGTPVIGTQVGTKNFLLHDFSGLVVDPKSSPQVVKSILYLKNNPDNARRYSKNGILTMSKSYTWDNYTKTWVSHIERCLEKISIQSTIVIPDKDSIKSNVKNIIKNSIIVTPCEIKPNALMESIKEKSNELKAYFGMTNKPKYFDKYDKFGAYHWNSTDLVYRRYVDHIVNIFKNLNQLDDGFSVLDVNGGDGYIASKIADIGCHVHLIEENMKCLQLAINKNLECGEDHFNKMKFSQSDLQSFVDTPDVILLNQYIPKVQNTKLVFDKLKALDPEVIIISSPIIRASGQMWDETYHFNEYTVKEFETLFESFSSTYKMNLSTQGIYNQVMVLQNKRKLLSRFIDGIIDESIKSEYGSLDIFIDSILTITNSNIKKTELE